MKKLNHTFTIKSITFFFKSNLILIEIKLRKAQFSQFLFVFIITQWFIFLKKLLNQK